MSKLEFYPHSDLNLQRQKIYLIHNLDLTLLGHSPRGLRPRIRKPGPADGATQGNQTGDDHQNSKK